MTTRLTPKCIADGPTLTRPEPASCVPVSCPLTLPAGYWVEGKSWRLTLAGKISSSNLDALRMLNVPSGFARYDLRLGGVVAWDSGEIALNSSGDFTNVPWSLTVELTCRAIGSAATLIGVGVFACADLDGASTSPPKAGGVIVVPVTAPAVGATFDSFAELQVGVFSASRYATGSRTVQQYSIEEI